MAINPNLLVITPSSPSGNYYPVTFGIAGDVPLNQIVGSGGWQVVDRPKQAAATQWYDRSPYQLVIPVIIDPSVTGVTATTPDQDAAQVMTWLSAPSLSSAIVQPPTLTLSGPILGTELTWILYTASWDKGLRDGQTGEILQQYLTLTLYEYNPPFPNSAATKSPAASSLKNTKNKSVLIHEIMHGETLAGICRTYMPNVKLATAEAQVLSLNKLRSASQIPNMQGVRIAIPSS